MMRAIRWISQVGQVLLGLCLLQGAALASDVASYDINTNRLTLPKVVIDNQISVDNLVLQLLSPGSVQVNDATVGSAIEFVTASRVLKLPAVSIAGSTATRVSLTNPDFVLHSYGSVSVISGTSGAYNLSLAVKANGATAPAIRIENVAKPANQAEFCVQSIYDQFTSQAQGVSGSWQVTGCSFSGMSGQVNALLTITSPVTLSVPYTAIYTYTAR